jgi:hypothetical protein
MKTKLVFLGLWFVLIGLFPAPGFAAPVTWDGGTYDITSGNYGEIGLINGASASVSGTAWFGRLELYDTSQATLNDDGFIYETWLFGNSKYTMNGGTEVVISARESSVVFIYGGSLEGIGAIGNSQINVFTNNIGNFILSQTGGKSGYGFLKGTLLNGDYIEVSLGSGAYSHVNLIPEPATMSLVLLGAFLSLRKQRRQG